METKFLKSLFSYVGLILLLWFRTELAIAYMLYLPLLLIPRRRWKEYALTLENWKLSLKLFVLASAVFLLPFTVLSIKLSYSHGFHRISFSLLIFQFLGAALPEEIFFRGFLQTEIEKITGGTWKSILLTSLLFSCAHLFRGVNPLTIGVFLPSLIFGYLRARTGSVLAPILFHATSNILFFCLF